MKVTYEVLHTEEQVPVFNDVFDTLGEAMMHAVAFCVEYPQYQPVEVREVRHIEECTNTEDCKCPVSRHWLVRVRI